MPVYAFVRYDSNKCGVKTGSIKIYDIQELAAVKSRYVYTEAYFTYACLWVVFFYLVGESSKIINKKCEAGEEKGDTL